MFNTRPVGYASQSSHGDYGNVPSLSLGNLVMALLGMIIMILLAMIIYSTVVWMLSIDHRVPWLVGMLICCMFAGAHKPGRARSRR